MRLLFSLWLAVAFSSPNVCGQADGNPHGWDRVRRCDQQDYSPVCGPCEGVGGIPTGSRNDQIELTSCTIVGAPDEMPEPVPIQWGTQWTLPLAYEVLIGKKTDPACFQTFPGNDSVGDLCYRGQTGSKVYDMLENLAIREDLEVTTDIGINVTSMVIHQGTNFWVVNDILGVDQCVCTTIKEGGGFDTLYYPVQYNWIEKMVYIGREIIGIEYINEVREMNHWAFGPHHMWTDIVTGDIIRMWQPFNGLQVYPGGVGQSNIDSTLFSEIPPEKCLPSPGLLPRWRIGCDDKGYPLPRDKKKVEKRPRDVVGGKDLARAEEKVPRGHYKGMNFGEMSDVLNGWLNSSTSTQACLDWDVEELQQLQALLYLARESQFDTIYAKTTDNRRLREQAKELSLSWRGLNSLASSHPDPRIAKVQRDGHCHEAVMWYVHHLTEEMKEILRSSGVKLPLLAPMHHGQGICSELEDESATKICNSYQEKVTCASCHSNELPPNANTPSPHS